MRIFQILEKHQFNTGSVHQMFQAAEGLAQRSHEVTIVSKHDATLAEKAREAGIDFRHFPFRNEADFTTIRGLSRLVHETHPDVIHVHKGLSHTLALLATWRNPVGAFIVNRGVSFDLSVWNRGKYRTRRVDRIVTVCEQIRQVTIRTGKVPPDKVQVVFAGTDVTLFDPSKHDRESFRQEKGIRSTDFLYMQVGVRDWKGWMELVDSFSDVAKQKSNVRLALIAYNSEEQRKEVERYAEAAGVGGLVVPVEYRSDMARVLASSDCVVDASWGGTGITGTIREAMALEKPAVATDCGGNVELLSSPELGWLVPPKDREALTRAMLDVLENPERSREIGARARRHVVSGFSREARLDRLEGLYREILRGKAIPV